MNLAIDDFELFGLPRRYALDRAELDSRRRALQAEVHPDRFAGADAAARRAAMQSAVRVNEAYGRLGDPLKRAAYLCELAGTPIRAEDNTAMPVEFLRQQMAWRESLDDAGSREELDAVADELANERRLAHERLASALDERHDFAGAAQQVRALMFIERFAADVDDRLVAQEG
ncbi:MAG: Fe-S protein assembly co-chaperone HscB [Pseudomonadota bacterium]|nr:Fe-S protein assembly co-chaperone HscB [Pseudomonadota bacterium]